MHISPATEADTDELSLLVAEIEQYYGGNPVPGDPDQIRRALFSPRPAATVLLARDGDQILGLASYSLLWPAAGADTSLYLKELYVREHARRRRRPSPHDRTPQNRRQRRLLPHRMDRRH
ncbi:hypothetical protein [Streptomyces sp. NBC_01190]|uniref:hypothetical protein n=1 Tax=Streptomyces sp. NBC_01190 TaxID=2903767 RepID=UPI00386BB616|nr:hypothetical protein OG519_18545 [Streptomyces sp. NBC_01190]